MAAKGDVDGTAPHEGYGVARPPGNGAGREGKVHSSAPLRFFLIVTLSVFISEAFVMFIVVPALMPLPQYALSLIDALLLTLLVLPMLYLFLLKPMMSTIRKRSAAEESLKEQQHRLEELVDERTHTLFRTVATLKDEARERIRAERELSGKSRELQILTGDLRELSNRLVREDEVTRRKLAGILHDQVGQNLVAIKMKCGNLIKEEFVPERCREEVASLIAPLQASLHATRKLTADLYPSILDDLGFVSAVRWYGDIILTPNGVQVTFAIDESVEDLPPESKLSLFRIVQELFQNIAKHASATGVEVVLKGQPGGTLKLSVTDNGVGFDEGETRKKSGKGIGFMLVKERVLSMGGVAQVTSSPGGGTVVSIQIPGIDNEVRGK